MKILKAERSPAPHFPTQGPIIWADAFRRGVARVGMLNTVTCWASCSPLRDIKYQVSNEYISWQNERRVRGLCGGGTGRD